MSFLDSRTSAWYHAAPSVPSPVANALSKFLAAVALGSRFALLDFKVAPLTCRGDMAMLGLLRGVALRLAPVR